MGIDLVAEFPEGIIPFEEEVSVYMKFALRDTSCNFVEMFRDYEYNLYAIYDNKISYWAMDQVRDMHHFLERMYRLKLSAMKAATDYEFLNEEGDFDRSEWELHDLYLETYSLTDIRAILDYFRVLVDNGGIIRVT